MKNVSTIVISVLLVAVFAGLTMWAFRFQADLSKVKDDISTLRERQIDLHVQQTEDIVNITNDLSGQVKELTPPWR